MATFSLGAPGVYINESAGLAGAASLANFSTVYMLVETEESVPTTRFPFNTPIPVTSLADYRVLLGGVIPSDRIPALSYDCVNEFFQNAQVGDLRVVRVGTPNQIVELEFFPSGTKLNSTSLPSALMAGDVVFVQMTINGIKLVAGDGSTGYTANGEWLGVPVTIPVNYVAGDEVNNRKISAAITAAVAAAIESNPSVRSSVYVRDSGLINDLNPSGNSQNGYVTISATTFDGNVSVVTEVFPVGSNSVFMQNTYDIENIVGQQTNLERVPQDYTQTITTAFDGQQDQGYLVTPTAYAQFDAAGRALVGAAAANHCASNNYKWMALADPGPYLVTDVNKYNDFTPHQAAADLVTGLKYLVDNAIFEWTGNDVTYNKLSYQSIVFGENAQTAVNESANLVADNVQVGLLDNGQYTINAVPTAVDGIFNLSTNQFWPVTLPIQEVTLSNAGVGNDFQSVSVQGQPGTFNLNGTTVYVIAPPADSATDSEYSLNKVFLATSAVDASNIYNAVVLAGGSVNITAPPTGSVYLAAPTGDTALLTYADPYWNLPVTVNGQTSNLIENISGANAGVNTLHLPGTLQNATDTYRLNWVSRTILSPLASVTAYSGSVTTFAGSANFNVFGHNLRSGQKIFFTQPITVTVGATTSNLVSQTTKLVSNPYWVKVIDTDNFVLSNSLNNYTVNSFVAFPNTGVVSAFPSIFYSQVLGGGLTTVSPIELLTLPMVRARKYEFDSSSIFNSALDSTVVPGAIGGTNPAVSIFLNNSSVILGEDQITPYGEDMTSLTKCGYLPELNLVNPTSAPVAVIGNAYCVPTVDQFFQPEAFLVPAVDAILGGSYDASAAGAVSAPTTYATQAGVTLGATGSNLVAIQSRLVGVYFNVTGAGNTPDGSTAVVIGDRIVLQYDGTTYTWAVISAASLGGDLSSAGQPCYGGQVELVFTPEQTPPSSLWRFDAITSTEIIDNALRGVGFNGVPQAVFIERGIDNVNALYDDSQRYFNPFGFIAYYGPWIENGSGVFIPPSPYVTGVAVRRYRAEGYQFPPAGVKYQLADAVSAQIPINSAQQNLLNPDGCNAIRTLPGYPNSAVFIWGGRTRVNTADAQQRLYQFVNTRVILNVVYGSLRTAFDSQIFNVIDGFGVVFNQIISVGNSVLNQLYVKGALFGARPSEAFQVICDRRINSAEDLENGIVNAKVFVTPVPTLERIQIDLIRVAIGQMQNELDLQGLGVDNS
jgi:hypothetical protein